MIQADSGFLLLAMFFGGFVIALALGLLFPPQVANTLAFAVAAIASFKIFQF